MEGNNSKSINDKFEELLVEFVQQTFTEKGADNQKLKADIIKLLLTPKLKWSHLYEHVWIGRTPFDYNYTLHLKDDGSWEVQKFEFQGTLDECKKECEKLFMEMYLNTCQ